MSSEKGLSLQKLHPKISRMEQEGIVWSWGEKKSIYEVEERKGGSHEEWLKGAPSLSLLNFMQTG